MSDTTETETETETNTNTDEPSKAELHERVEQLESTVAKMMPSRRDALRMGAVGLAGAVGVGAASQSADASTGSAGDIGDPSNRPDLFADTVDANQLTGSAGGIKTKTRVFVSGGSSANPVPFDAVSYDPDSNYDTSANEYIAPADGTYQITVNIRLNSPSSTRADFAVKQSGTPFAIAEATSQGNFVTTSVTDIREFTSGDSITVSNNRGATVLQGVEDSFLTVIRLD